MHELISLWMSWVQDWGYAGVIVLMAMESSIFPVPSEVVIPPAAILSAQDGASMSFWGVVVAGTFGSWLGSAITYAVARIVGRPVIMRWGKFFFMPPNKVEKAEVFLQRYEVSGVFFARLLPVIRHLISIPAGASCGSVRATIPLKEPLRRLPSNVTTFNVSDMITPVSS